MSEFLLARDLGQEVIPLAEAHGMIETQFPFYGMLGLSVSVI